MTSIDYAELASTDLEFATIVFATAASLLLAGRGFVLRSRHLRILVVLAVNALAAWVVWKSLRPGWELVGPVLLGVTLPIVASRLLKGFSFTGRFLMAAHLNLTLAGLCWGLFVIVDADVGPLTRSLIGVTFALAVISLVVGLIQSFEQWEILCRHRWRRPRVVGAIAARTRYPKVSLHVPAYAEPPELVVATLDALARLQYPNFEVLVIDNNTRDPALWKPVEAHCQRLGDRFRFFHLDSLPGAKAGALNFALGHTAADAELIGVVDSDYRVKPNFLSALVGYFDDPHMGFVQTPQAYRAWRAHPYLRMCNWEYKVVFATTLVSRNERIAALTVGTMGLIRRKALEQVGGWAEWCVTEDSELAVRIHAQGYRSLYLNDVFGEGLIPERFEDYKKQRFRWTYGPIQELRRHFPLFLPKPFARPSALTAAQKIHHLMHGVGATKSALEFLMLPLGALTVASMLAHGEAIDVPAYVWPTFGAAAIAAFVLKLHLFRTSMSFSVKDMFGAIAAGMALDYIIKIASLRGLFTRNTAWRRTNKFKAVPLGFGSLGATMPELLLAGTIGLGVSTLAVYPAPGLVRLFMIGWLIQGTQFLAAPLMSILAEHGIRRRAHLKREETTSRVPSEHLRARDMSR